MIRMMDVSKRTLQFIVLMGLTGYSLESCETKLMYLGRCMYYRGNCYDHINVLECDNINGTINSNTNMANMQGYLGTIKISNSSFSTLKSGVFRNFDRITNITMYESNISTIEPGAFNGLFDIQSLNLSHNNIQNLSKGIFNALIHLKTLDLSNNQIAFVEQDFLLGMHNLEELYINDNNISDMLALVSNCEKLVRVDLSNNVIQNLQLPGSCTQLRYLYVANNNIEVLTGKLFESFKLISLDICNNLLDYIHSDTFQNLESLQNLNISQNALFKDNDIPVDLFRYTASLVALNLSATEIRNIRVGTFSQLKELKVLDLSLNYLISLPKGLFHDLTSLNELYLNGNRLSNFFYDGPLTLHVINLNDNIWNCDILSSIIKMFRKYSVLVARGCTFNTTNMFGIACNEETNQLKYEENNSTYLDDAQKGYTTINDYDVKQALLSLKSYLNQTNFDQKNYRENYLKSLQGYQSALQKQQSDFAQTLLTITNYSKNYWENSQDYRKEQLESEKALFKIVNALQYTINNASQPIEGSKMFDDIKLMLSELKNAQIHSYSVEDKSNAHWTSLDDHLNYIQHELTNIGNGVSSSGSVSGPLIKNMANVSNTANFKSAIQEPSTSRSSDTVALYCIFLILLIVLALMLSKTYRKYKRSGRNREECSPLSTLQV